MAERESIYLFSSTAANNATADGSINWAEGQLPGTVNNSARSQMAAVARFRDDTTGGLTSGGSANAYTLTISGTQTAYANKQVYSFKANFSNTGAATLNVTNADATAIGAKAIRVFTPSGEAALSANMIRSGGHYLFQYDTAANGAAGAFILLNPSTNADGSVNSTALGSAAVTSAKLDVSALAMAQGMINGRFNCTVAGNALTIALKETGGGDPSATQPVLFVFRSIVAAAGEVHLISVTSALSVVVSSGSTLGTTSNVPFDLYVTAHDSAGSVVLGVINNTSGMLLDDTAMVSTTAEGGAGNADSANTFYTTSSVASRPFRAVARLRYTTALATAGTWSAAPDSVDLVGGTLAMPRTPILDTFTSTSTWTKRTGLTAVVVEALGAGGGGGGSASTSGAEVAFAGGGGAGGRALARILAFNLSATETVTVPGSVAGGTAGPNNGSTGGANTSFGTLVVATPGAGGGGAANVGNSFVSGGLGGVGSVGDLKINGASGMGGFGTATAGQGFGGAGGSNPYGAGGRAAIANAAGADGLGYGAGGAGASSGTSTTAKAGGAGMGGLVLVWNYFT